MRKLLVLAAALTAALAVSASAAAGTLTFTSPFSLETQTPLVDANGNGEIEPGDTFRISGVLLNTVPQFGQPAGALVGSWVADAAFGSDGLIRVRGLFTYPRLGRILAHGVFDPMVGAPTGLDARGLSGRIDGFGTLDVADSVDSSIYTFTFPWEPDPIR
jgi:hypothetical protein